jgi:CMP-2-keto-3-deoxyoctulosonic acid synthetase
MRLTLEGTENEQLRALECGFRIKVVLVDYPSLHVDTQRSLQIVISCQPRSDALEIHLPENWV